MHSTSRAPVKCSKVFLMLCQILFIFIYLSWEFCNCVASCFFGHFWYGLHFIQIPFAFHIYIVEGSISIVWIKVSVFAPYVMRIVKSFVLASAPLSITIASIIQMFPCS